MTAERFAEQMIPAILIALVVSAGCGTNSSVPPQADLLVPTTDLPAEGVLSSGPSAAPARSNHELDLDDESLHAWLTKAYSEVPKLENAVGALTNEEATGNLPLRVLYLARSNAVERQQDFVELFSAHFQEVAWIRRDKFDPSMAADFDVVVLDWSQDERQSGKYASPLGDLDEWNTPTVLLGSAGHLMAGPWYVVGGAG